MSSPVNQPPCDSASVDVEPALSVASLPGLTPGSVKVMVTNDDQLISRRIPEIPSRTQPIGSLFFSTEKVVNTGMNQPNIV